MVSTSFILVLCALVTATSAISLDGFTGKHLVVNDGLGYSQNGAPKSVFLSNDEKLCAEGPARVVEGALALFKALPRGALYNTTFAHPATTSCVDRGYTLRYRESPCYPGLQLFFKGAKEMRDFIDAENETLKEFGHRYNLSKETVLLMDQCPCHSNSTQRKNVDSQCASLDNMPGSWVHHNFDGEELMCDGGPYVLATRALAVLKSTAQLPMHLGDQIAPVPCNELGFGHKYPPIDHCFTGLHMWTRTWPMELDAGISQSTAVEDALFNQGSFQQFVEKRELDGTTLNGIGGCHCAPNSEVGESMRDECAQPNATSPIRDWWKD